MLSWKVRFVLLLFIGVLLAEEVSWPEHPCPYKCEGAFNSLFLHTNIEEARTKIEEIQGPCKYFYKWYISSYVDFSPRESIEYLYKSLYSTCSIKDLAYLVYASKIERRHGIVSIPQEAIFYYREIAKEVFEGFFKKRTTLFAKWEFSSLNKQGENTKIIDFVKTLTSGGDTTAAENLLSLIRSGHVDLHSNIDFLKDLARKGSPDAMGILGNMYFYGWTVQPSRITARHYFAEGAKKEDPDCLNGLGMLYAEEKNLPRARAYFEKASALGSHSAEYNLFLMYENKHIYMADIHLAKSAKQDGYLPAVYSYAEKAWNRKEFTESVLLQYKSIAAYHPSVTALEKLAIAKYQNKEIKESFYLSVLIGDMGSRIGYANGLYALGKRVVCPGVERVAELAVLLMRRLSDMSSSTAAVSLGDSYFLGRGVEMSYEKAFARYNSASLMGSSEGDYLTGWMYEMGYGVERNYKLAAEYYGQMYRRRESAYLVYWVVTGRVWIKRHAVKLLTITAVCGSVSLGWLTVPQAVVGMRRRTNCEVAQ